MLSTPVVVVVVVVAIVTSSSLSDEIPEIKSAEVVLGRPKWRATVSVSSSSLEMEKKLF